jgi:predicted transcriptional regulator
MAVRKVITNHEAMRRRCGFSVTELARQTGYSHAYVSRVEGGHLRPSRRYKREVSRVLRLPEPIIFGAEETA